MSYDKTLAHDRVLQNNDDEEETVLHTVEFKKKKQVSFMLNLFVNKTKNTQKTSR